MYTFYVVTNSNSNNNNNNNNVQEKQTMLKEVEDCKYKSVKCFV